MRLMLDEQGARVIPGGGVTAPLLSIFVPPQAFVCLVQIGDGGQ